MRNSTKKRSFTNCRENFKTSFAEHYVKGKTKESPTYNLWTIYIVRSSSRKSFDKITNRLGVTLCVMHKLIPETVYVFILFFYYIFFNSQ